LVLTQFYYASTVDKTYFFLFLYIISM